MKELGEKYLKTFAFFYFPITFRFREVSHEVGGFLRISIFSAIIHGAFPLSGKTCRRDKKKVQLGTKSACN